MPNGLSGYVAYPKADLVALLHTLPPETVVGFKFDIERYRQTGAHPEPIAITAAVLLQLLGGWAHDVVPIDEHEFAYFAIRLDGLPMDIGKWVRVLDTSPLFAELIDECPGSAASSSPERRKPTRSAQAAFR